MLTFSIQPRIKSRSNTTTNGRYAPISFFFRLEYPLASGTLVIVMAIRVHRAIIFLGVGSLPMLDLHLVQMLGTKLGMATAEGLEIFKKQGPVKSKMR